MLVLVTDDTKVNTPDTEPAGATGEPGEPEKSLFGVPVSVFVKGGTSTSAHDRQVAAIEADAERRRDIAAEERKIAAVPLEQGGGKIYSNQFSSNANVEAGFVLLKYLTPKGDVRYENGDELQCLADVHMLAADELSLTLVCPTCKSRGVPQGQCQMRLRQKNKNFDLDLSKAGQMFVFDGKPYRSAGVVRESERFRCDQCGWTARIVDNCVRPE
jgi:hypothetical protein